MLNEVDFTSRLEAAMALRKEREGREERSGVDHRKDKNNSKKSKKNSKKQAGKNHKRKPAFAKNHNEEPKETTQDDVMEDEDDAAMVTEENDDDDSDNMEEEPPEINPCQSLFDNHTSPSVEENLRYMQQNYSFYLPDPEYCIDLEGFLGYANEKVRWGNVCLYCQKTIDGGVEGHGGVLKHMKDKEHCVVRYERGVDMEEFDVFYDFSKQPGAKKDGPAMDAVEEGDGEEVDEEEWEDVDDEDDVDMENGEEDDLYDAYQEEMTSRGYDITPLGELILPDGRIVGHRGLARYYKQRFAPDRMERSAAVRSARDAGGDRLYNGRVVNLYKLQEEMAGGEGGSGEAGESTALATTMGRMAGSIPTGRNGRGILVGSKAGDAGFTSLSLYRYRAAVKKQRREDARGQRLQYRSQMNMNKMNKKGNNIATGVVTAMLPR